MDGAQTKGDRGDTRSGTPALEVAGLVKERRALGELDHPEDSVINLKNASHMVTDIWWDGNKVMGKVKVLNTPLTGDGAGPAAFDPVKGMKFDYIVDNWSKGTDNANCVIDVAKSSGTSQHIFISSAGMYKTEGSAPPGATEAAEVKENDARKVEIAVAGADIPYTFLRPQV